VVETTSRRMMKNNRQVLRRPHPTLPAQSRQLIACKLVKVEKIRALWKKALLKSTLLKLVNLLMWKCPTQLILKMNLLLLVKRVKLRHPVLKVAILRRKQLSNPLQQKVLLSLRMSRLQERVRRRQKQPLTLLLPHRVNPRHQLP
jgi:hypothetical protein